MKVSAINMNYANYKNNNRTANVKKSNPNFQGKIGAWLGVGFGLGVTLATGGLATPYLAASLTNLAVGVGGNALLGHLGEEAVKKYSK